MGGDNGAQHPAPSGVKATTQLGLTQFDPFEPKATFDLAIGIGGNAQMSGPSVDKQTGSARPGSSLRSWLRMSSVIAS